MESTMCGSASHLVAGTGEGANDHPSCCADTEQIVSALYTANTYLEVPWKHSPVRYLMNVNSRL